MVCTLSQVFFVDDPDDSEWKVVLEKQPRSRRHTQEDDDVFRPDSAEHVFDAAGLPTQTATSYGPTADNSQSRASTSRSQNFNVNDNVDAGGENIPEADVQAVAANMEVDDNSVAWLEDDFEDEDNNMPYDSEFHLNHVRREDLRN